MFWFDLTSIIPQLFSKLCANLDKLSETIIFIVVHEDWLRVLEELKYEATKDKRFKCAVCD